MNYTGQSTKNGPGEAKLGRVEYTNPAVPAPERGISTECAAQSELVNSLLSSVRELEARLNPILSPPCPEPPEQAIEGSSDMSRHLNYMNQRISLAIAFVEQLRVRVTL